jgi:hypothetical protein
LIISSVGGERRFASSAYFLKNSLALFSNNGVREPKSE